MTKTAQPVLRAGGMLSFFTRPLMQFVMEKGLPAIFRLLRNFPLGNRFVVTRYDEVREVFLNDKDFKVPYEEKLSVIMGGKPFFLSMGDTTQYRTDVAAMRRVVLIDDIRNTLAPAVTSLAENIVAKSNGKLEVVDELVRKVTFDVYSGYFGVTAPPNRDLAAIATRLFEFQFADGGDDPSLLAEVEQIAPLLRDHIYGLLKIRRDSKQFGDDVLGRCLKLQAAGVPEFAEDSKIVTSLMGFIVGGPPQPPMVVPQALEQLLRRKDALAGAQEAARADNDDLLHGYVMEAMRFDPLAPFLPRVAVKESVIARGTWRQVTVPANKTVMVSFSSAMMDERRIFEPGTFNPNRLPHEYIHFGHGLHQCFGIHMNQALLPLMLKPLLKRNNLRRAPGRQGRLRKQGAFAERLFVEYDPLPALSPAK